jgi:hypothetical protein
MSNDSCVRASYFYDLIRVVPFCIPPCELVTGLKIVSTAYDQPSLKHSAEHFPGLVQHW